MTNQQPMMLYQGEDEALTEISWQTASDQANRLAQALRELGVKPGDRVVAYMPNIPETVTSMLAVSGLGGVFTSTSCDFGVEGVVVRFSQRKPKVVAFDTVYQYNGKTHRLIC